MPLSLISPAMAYTDALPAPLHLKCLYRVLHTKVRHATGVTEVVYEAAFVLQEHLNALVEILFHDNFLLLDCVRRNLMGF